MNRADLRRCRVVVVGRVQGVWYRDSCRREAEALGVAGRVWNRRDGAVEAVIEGPTPTVDKLLAWMQQGPPRANVQRVDVTDEVPQGDPPGFSMG